MTEPTTNAILLTTLNARYMHCAFALRYLYANLGELQQQAQIVEFTIQQRTIDIVEQLLTREPRIIGFSVYIWNVTETAAVVALLKQVSPQTSVVLGGPEVSFADDLPAFAEQADCVITGPGEISFRQLCRDLLRNIPLASKVIAGTSASLDQLELPYAFYNDEDLRNRLIYVEASRGCPFKCEFCLSALDKTAKSFELGRFLDAMENLHRFRWQGKGLLPWLIRIGKNLCLDHLRKAGRTSAWPEGFEQQIPDRSDSNAESLLGRAELSEVLRERIDACMTDLNPRYRRVLELRMIEKRTRHDAAEQLEVTIGTLDVLLFRACKSFRKVYVRHYGSGGEGPEFPSA